MADDRRNLTASAKETPSFPRGQPPSRWVGVLTPIAGLSAAVIHLEQDELVVGRDKDCGAVLPDESVSRRARPHHQGGRRVRAGGPRQLQRHHVDGVPVLSCVLHDGDTVQLGQNLYSFELALRPLAAAAAGAAREGQQ